MVKHALLSKLNKPVTSIAVVPWLRCDSSRANDEQLLELSERFRLAGADAIGISGCGLEQVRLLLDEQRGALGQFPSCCPVIFQPPASPPPDWAALASLDVDGVLLDESYYQGEISEHRGSGMSMLVPHATSVPQLKRLLTGGGALTVQSSVSRLVVASGSASKAVRAGEWKAAGDVSQTEPTLFLSELPLAAFSEASIASLREAGAPPPINALCTLFAACQ